MGWTRGKAAGFRDGRQATGIQVNAGRSRLPRLVARLKCIPETVRWALRDACQPKQVMQEQEACVGGRWPGRAGAASSLSGEEEKEKREGEQGVRGGGKKKSSSFGTSATCRREGNRPVLTGSRCTHQNPCRMRKRVDDTCFGKPYGWHRMHHEIGATSLQNPFWHYETHI